MGKNNLAVLVPLSPDERQMTAHDGYHNQLRVSVWKTVSECLSQWLGQKYTSFMPAVCAWNLPLMAPFGVILGAAEAEPFLAFYAAAHLAQIEAVERYEKALKQDSKILAQNIELGGGMTASVIRCESRNPNTRAAVEWCTRFSQGELSTDAGIYFCTPGCVQVPKSMENQILTHISDYALCVVELHQ